MRTEYPRTASAMSVVGTFRTWRDVCLRSVMRFKAEFSQILAKALELVERHADSLFPTPYDVAGQMVSLRWQGQGELLGDFDRVSHVEHCAGIREIANHAIDSSAAELNRSGLENTMSRRIAVLSHGVPKIGPKT